MPAAAILFFIMRLISVPEKITPPMKISCNFGEPSWSSFPLRALTPKIFLRTAVAAKPKYPPVASGGYKYEHCNITSVISFGHTISVHVVLILV